MEKNPILIVDDEPSYLELMKDFLNQEGYTNVITESNPLNVIPLHLMDLLLQNQIH